MEKCTSSSSSSINGLKFGKKIYFEDMGSAELHHHKTGPPSPAKKGRTAMVATPRCQVEGCNVDLRDAKAYYSKHKVCGMHSKSPKVIVSGIEQRFCQQCSRSCRRRLAGHNERRRKPSPGSLLSSPQHGNNHGNSGPGGFVMDFTAYSTHSWPSAASGQVLEYRKPQLTWLSSSSSSPHNPVPELLQDALTPPSHSSFNVSDSNGALSLLSNNSWSSKPCPSGFEPSSVQASLNPGGDMPQYACPAWALHDMPPDLGLGQASHPANNSYAGELGLAQPGDTEFRQVDQSRGFGSSLQNMHWSR